MKIRSFQWQIVKIKLLHMYQKCLYSKSMTRHLLEFGYNLVTTFYEKAFNHYPNFVVWCKCIFGVFFHFVEFFWVNWTIFRSPSRWHLVGDTYGRKKILKIFGWKLLQNLSQSKSHETLSNSCLNNKFLQLYCKDLNIFLDNFGCIGRDYGRSWKRWRNYI